MLKSVCAATLLIGALLALSPPPLHAQADAADMLPFDIWQAQFRARALAAGIDAALFDEQFDGLTLDPAVQRRDLEQPEVVRPISVYLRGVLDAQRIADGRRHVSERDGLVGVERDSGVPREILVAIWALESAYGRIQGSHDVLRALATLGADGRRRAFAESELIAALRVLQTGRAERAQLIGSWAGAIGQTQFLPSRLLSTAVDGDGDGRIDLRASAADALASAAQLLAGEGWVRGGSWAVEVTLADDFDYRLTESRRLTPAQWAEHGVRRADGRQWHAADAEAEAQLLLPAGVDGPAFLAFPNHFVLRAYNNSIPYALGVGLLADRIAGAAPLRRDWPQEQALSLDQRVAAQQALARLGYDPGPADGIVGAGTRRALRAWQADRGLPPDGYLTPALVERLADER